MSESEFNIVVILVFVIVVIGAAVGFTFFIRWYKRDTTTVHTPESLLRRQAELEARFRRLHPDAEEESSGSGTPPEDPTGS
ncbi:MAG TPA: hypothetical protein VKT78_00865 [Fimbriimonadaceae bacterium]|nr:hypothetical protein [Fimbriimonadaceae bacterium]